MLSNDTKKGIHLSSEDPEIWRKLFFGVLPFCKSARTFASVVSFKRVKSSQIVPQTEAEIPRNPAMYDTLLSDMRPQNGNSESGAVSEKSWLRSVVFYFSGPLEARTQAHLGSTESQESVVHFY